MSEIDTLKEKISSQEFSSLGYEEKFSLLQNLTKLLVNQNPTESIQYGKTSLLLAQKMEDPLKTASALLQLSHSYFVLSHSSKALQYAFEALKIYESLNNSTEKARVINNIASIYTTLEDFDKAFHYNERALEIHLQNGNEKGMAGTFINIGLCYDNKNDQTSAISYYEKGLDIFQKNNDILKSSYAFHNLGSLYIRQNKYEEALKALKMSLIYRKQVDDTMGIANTLEKIGLTYSLMNLETEALEHLDEALQLAKNHNFRKVEQCLYDDYCSFYASKKDFEKALDFQKKYTDLKDQILQDNNAEQIEKLRYLYEIERKEKEIEERSRHLEELKIINESLESFSYSISHDLRAPLRAINSFSNILLNDYQDKFEKDALRYLNVIQSNTIKMDQLITDLLSLAKVSRSEISISEIDMNELVNEVFEDLATKEIREKIAFSIETLKPSFGDKNLIRIVWVNLLSNAIKFTLANTVKFIVIGSYIENNTIVYFVRDSGIGFEDKYVPKLFKTFQRLNNAEGVEGTGIGLAIVKRVMDRLGGKVWAKGIPNEGATFSFSLPDKLT
jgi:signal transduction histidine kinase/Tfp pilus assembly protein PilF